MLKLTSLYGAATIGMALICAGCATQPVQPPLTSVPADMPTAWTKNAKITAVNVSETDESKLLGLNMWRFDIAAPQPKHDISLIVEAREKNQPPQTLTSLTVSAPIGWPANKHLHIFVGQAPLYDGHDVTSKASYIVGVDAFHCTPTRQIGGSSASAVADNPLSGTSTSSSGTPSQDADGSFKLSYGYKTNPAQAESSSPDAALVFRVEEQAY